MANNRISVVIDIVADKANQSLKSFRQSITDADGAAGKFKAGTAGAFDAVKQNAGNLALAGGAALIAFGAKSIAAFQDTALAAGQLRDSLGVTAEEASRLAEVAEDLGIGTATLEKSISIMNRTAANTPEHFAAIGAELVKNADGTTNVNETFLSTIDALNKIPDASQRAAAAQKVFGRGWQEMAELISLGAEDVRDALAAVEEGKVIDDKEISEARRFRDALDALRGTSEELVVQVGGKLVPVIADLAEELTIVYETGRKLGGLIPEQVTKPLGMLTDQVQRSLMPWKYYTDFAGQAAETTGTLGDLTGNYSDALEENTEEVEGNTQALNQRVAALEASEQAEREAQSASLSYRQQVADTTRAVAEATLKQLDATLTDEQRAQAARDAEAAVLSQADAAVKFAEEQAAANGETFSAKVKTQIYIDELNRLVATLSGPAAAEIQAHIARLRGIPGSIATNIAVRSSAGYRGSTGGGIDGDPATPFAEGGIVKARPGGLLARIGEAGHDEAVIPLSGPNAPKMGGDLYVTINADPNPDVTVRKLREWVRRNGPIQGLT